MTIPAGRSRLRPVVAFAVSVLALLCCATGARAEFSLAIDEPKLADADRGADVLAHMNELAVGRARMNLSWSVVAPAGAAAGGSRQPPEGFIARDPGDPRYRWTVFDAVVRSAAQSGKELVVTVSSAPDWARGPGTPPPGASAAGFKVHAADYADFAYAAALRYSGAYPDPLLAGASLPRVRFWQAWNEPTLPIFLYPSTTAHYLPLLNGFYDAVKSVAADNFVIAGGLAPVKSSRRAAFPLRFAAEMLCVDRRGEFRDERFRSGRCKTPRARFDALSIHPYSLGAKPGQSSAIDGNVFVANVPTLAKMLRLAARSGQTVTRSPRLWVTEFALFTNPPNKSIGERPGRAGLHAGEALYRLWKSGVDTVTWHMLYEGKDEGILIPGGALIDGSGRPKPTYAAMRFPLFVRHVGRRTLVWGRAPLPNATVTFDGRISPIVSGADGVFSRYVNGRIGGKLTANQNGVKSLATPAVAGPR